MMVTRNLLLVISVAALAVASFAQAQKATEMFIPIGQSPGVSGKVSLMGNIVSVDRAKSALDVTGPAGARTVRVGERTQIWLDRSAERQPNRYGSFADLQPGRTVEVKPLQAAPDALAEWIKVRP